MGCFACLASRALAKIFGRVPLRARDIVGDLYQDRSLIITYENNSAAFVGANIATVEAFPTNNSDLAYFEYGNGMNKTRVEGTFTGWNDTKLPNGIRYGQWHFAVPGLENQTAYGQWIQVVETASPVAKAVFNATEAAIDDEEVTWEEVDAIMDALKKAS